MKQRISKNNQPVQRTKPSIKRPNYPKNAKPLTSAQADRDVIEIYNSINAASQNQTDGRAVRRSVRNRRRNQKVAEDTKEKTRTARPAKNHDFCDTCGESGLFICCDGCPNVFHFACVEPPIHNVEELGEFWYCETCEQKRSNGKQPNINTTTTTTEAPGDPLFKELLDNLDGQNPTSYRMSEIIYIDFEDVSSDRYGDYVDTSAIKRVKLKNGQPILPDYHQLKANDGTPISCYHCRKSALHQAIIKCDFCPAFWHLDCLDPPLAIPPNISRKWMCPLHIEHSIKTPRKRKSEASNIADIDPNAPLSSHINYFSDVIDQHPIKKQKITSASNQVRFNDRIVSTKNGAIYRLPETPFMFSLGALRK